MRNYIFKRQLLTFLIIFIPITLILSLFQIVKIVDSLHLEFLPVNTYLFLIGNSIPISSKFSIPLSGFVAFFVVSGLFYQNNEIEAMYTLGVTKIRFLLWFSTFPAIISLIAFLNIFEISPYNFRKLKDKLAYIVAQNLKNIIESSEELNLGKNLSFYYDEKTKSYHTMFIPEKGWFFLRGKDIKTRIEGKFINFEIYNGKGYLVGSSEKNTVIKFDFDTYAFQIASSDLFPTVYGIELNELNFKALKRAIKRSPEFHFLKTDLWKRFSLGFSPLFFAFGALFIAFLSGENWKDRGSFLASLYLVWYYILLAGGKKLGYQGILPSFVFWGTLLFIFIPPVLIWYFEPAKR